MKTILACIFFLILVNNLEAKRDILVIEPGRGVGIGEIDDRGNSFYLAPDRTMVLGDREGSTDFYLVLPPPRDSIRPIFPQQRRHSHDDDWGFIGDD